MSISGLKRYIKKEPLLFAFNLNYLFVIGLWPDEKFTRSERILYKILELTMTLLSFIFIAISFAGTYQLPTILDKVGNFGRSFVGYNYFVKMILFLNRQKEIKALIEDIQSAGDFVSEERRKIMDKQVLFVTMMPLTVVLAFTAFAVYEGEMSVYAWLPFEPDKDRMHLLAACQIMAFFFVPCSCRGSAMQSIICSLIMYMCDQLKYMQRDLKLLKYSEENEVKMRKAFRKIIVKHIRLIRYANTMEEIFKGYMLVQNFCLTAEICLIAVLMATIGMAQVTLLVTFIAYLSTVLVNAYIYSYLGNELIIQSEQVAQAAYESGWYDWPVDMQKSILTIITSAQRAFKLTAGGMSTLSIETLSQAMYNGYSVYAVLKDALN